ncbi:TauD/TfdA dioxygenase family protein [Bordetella tumulicola]|uniref:TauD/TfdA dioxygenase family protein n=1 Tax=Bordetella tumulicola TaxID=1649133 RepID=UPI0039F02156
MTLQVRPFNALFAAQVTGIDLRQPLSRDTYEKLEDALATYGVLGIPSQPIDDAQQVQFSSGFGPLHQASRDPAQRRIKDPNFQDVSNLNLQGEIARSGERAYSDANLLWHTDLSFVAASARITVLSARELPAEPPPTEFADMRAAWDALPTDRQRELEGLQVEHSVLTSRAKTGYTRFTEAERKVLPPVTHPLVRRHPRSGRKSLYLASHASHIIGWPVEKGRALLADLIEYATQPQFVFAYQWNPFDVLMWDDTCTMHRAVPFDSRNQRRELRWNAVVEPA